MPICNTCLSELDGGKPLDPSIRAMTYELDCFVQTSKIKCSRCRCWKYEREFSNPAEYGPIRLFTVALRASCAPAIPVDGGTSLPLVDPRTTPV